MADSDQVHHSRLQPRNEKGRFAGPPRPSGNGGPPSPSPDSPDELKANLREATSTLMALTSVLSERQEFASRFGLQFDQDRDLMDTLGYQDKLTKKMYVSQYERGGVAARIVDSVARDTWSEHPEIVDPNGQEGESEFTRDWEALAERLSFFHYAERADRLQRILEYSLMVIMVAGEGDQELSDPLPEDLDRENVMALAVFRQDHAEVESWITDPFDPDGRFGLPDTYMLDLKGHAEDQDFDPDEDEVEIHWSRVIHFAGDLLENDVFSRPALQTSWNYLQDLLKVAGGSAEMYWQDAAAIWFANLKEGVDLGEDEDAEMEELEDQFQEALDGLRRLIQAQGMEFDIMRGESPKPGETWEMLRALIAGSSTIPQRKLFGSEAGNVAGESDETSYNARINRRRERTAEPVLRTFIDRMVQHGAVTGPEREGEYDVEWPNPFALSETEEAEVAKNRGQAARQVAEAQLAGLPISDSEAREILLLPPERPDQDELDREIEDEDAQSRREAEREGDAGGEGEGGGPPGGPGEDGGDGDEDGE